VSVPLPSKLRSLLNYFLYDSGAAQLENTFVDTLFLRLWSLLERLLGFLRIFHAYCI